MSGKIALACTLRSNLSPILDTFAVSLSRALKTSSGEDSHDDFKPQIKGSASKSVSEQIEEDISQSSVFIYMKGVPQAPMCGFSNMACRILDAYEVKYGFRDVLSDPELREGVKQFTSWPTIPQVFIKGEFVGGSDILYQMHQSGELKGKLD